MNFCTQIQNLLKPISFAANHCCGLLHPTRWDSPSFSVELPPTSLPSPFKSQISNFQLPHLPPVICHFPPGVLSPFLLSPALNSQLSTLNPLELPRPGRTAVRMAFAICHLQFAISRLAISAFCFPNFCFVS
jgi:hypothetical protein